MVVFAIIGIRRPFEDVKVTVQTNREKYQAKA